MSKATEKEGDELARGAGQPINPAPVDPDPPAGVATDPEGKTFTRGVHREHPDGSPVTQRFRRKDGSIILRLQRISGRKPNTGDVGVSPRVAKGPGGSQGDGENASEKGGETEKAPSLGSVLTLLTERFGTAACRQGAGAGKPWGGEMDPIERQGLTEAIDRYAEANGGDIPPGVAILLLGGQYLYRVYQQVEELRAQRKATAAPIVVEPSAGVRA
jgi:hypothetical protein